MVRMGGQSNYQRSTMTVDHCVYFLDTSVTLATQNTEEFSGVKPCPTPVKSEDPACEPRSVNLFQGGQTYYMFFLYQKQTTRQTYQIYVGQNFNPSTDLKAVRANVQTMPVNSFTEIGWPAGWPKDYNTDAACGGPGTAGCGVLQVTVDMKGFTDLDAKATTPGLCKPATFCSVSGSTCGCALSETDPKVVANHSLLDECTRTCNVWAIKDLDYPPIDQGKLAQSGPYGFSFKMPANADGTGLAHRPAPKLFQDPTVTADWTAAFARTATLPEMSSGSCYYPRVPTLVPTDLSKQCSMPTTTPVP